MKQIQISRNEKRGVVWTDENPKIKAGNSIRFKDEKEFWNIDAVYDKSINKDEIKRTWHVGGL